MILAAAATVALVAATAYIVRRLDRRACSWANDSDLPREGDR